MRRVALVAAGVTRFGVRKAGLKDLIWEAGKAVFGSNSRVRPKDVEGLVVGTVMPERTANQSHIASLAAECLGIKPQRLSARTEHMCASGSVAIRYAHSFIASGLADLILVLGVEKLNLPNMDEALFNMGAGVDRDWEACYGLTAPPCFALAAQMHMTKYGTTEEQLALVSVKTTTTQKKIPMPTFKRGLRLTRSFALRSSLRLCACTCAPLSRMGRQLSSSPQRRGRRI